MTGHGQHLEGLGVPPRKASGSRFSLQVLSWITSLWAFRCNRSRADAWAQDIGVPRLNVAFTMNRF